MAINPADYKIQNGPSIDDQILSGEVAVQSLTDQDYNNYEQANNIYTHFPTAVRIKTAVGGVVWVTANAVDVIEAYERGILTGGVNEAAAGGVILRVLPTILPPPPRQVTVFAPNPDTAEFAEPIVPISTVTIVAPTIEPQITLQTIPQTPEQIKTNIQELQKPIENRIPLVAPLTAPTPGAQSIQFVIRVEQENVQLSQTELPLNINIAPYDPVLVPLRQAMTDALQQKIRNIVQNFSDPERYLKTLLNFGDDIQRILINWKLDPNDSTKLLVKLLEPIDLDFEVGQNVLISREVANTIVDTVKIEIAPLQDTSLWLRPLNNDLKVLNSAANILRNKNLENIGISVEGSDDTYGNYSFANEILRRWFTDDYRSSELNIDYTNYNNFVKFSSAEARLAGFRQQLLRLYALEQNSRYLGGFAEDSIFGTNAFLITTPVTISSPSASYPSPTTLVPPSGSLLISTGSTVTIFSPPELPSSSLYLREGSKKAALEMEEIIRGFDGYERYLFYGSGSAYSASVYWTDNNTEYNIDGTWPKRDNGTLYLPTETEAINWYATQSVIANRYDEFNHQTMINSIPSYLQSDTQSAEFITFTKLIGHFFDNIRLYIENFTKIYDRNVSATDGLSQDLVWEVSKAFGLNLINPHAMDSLYNYITDSTSLTKRRELTTELFKRFLHNSLYLNRIKGSRTSLQALLNIFGLNEQIVTIRESDTPTTGSFEIFDEVTNALNFNSGSYLQLPLSSSFRDIHTVQFRFASTNKQVTTLTTGDNLWHMRLNTHPSGASSLGKIEVTNNIGEVLLTSSYSNFFSGDYFDVMLRYNTSSVNLQVAKSDGEEILYTSSMHTTASYLRNALPLTSNMYLGGSGSLSLNNFDGTVDEVRIWGEEIENDNFLDQALNPGSFAGNAYWSAAENLYVRLSFHKPQNLSSGSTSNDTPYKNKDGVSDPTKPLLPNLSNILAYGFTNQPAFPYQMSRITRRVYQYTTNGGASAYGSNKIIIQPPAIFKETTPLGEPLLSRTKSIVSIEERKQQPQSKKFVGFFVSPTDATNNIIVRSLGNFNIADAIGYPGNQFKNAYPNLEAFKSYYNQYYSVAVNIPQFVRFFDKISPVLFEQAKTLVPAKTTLATGIIIEPNLLERKKVLSIKPTKFSGANTKRNTAAVSTSRTRHRDMDITVSTETDINIKSQQTVNAAYTDILALYDNAKITILSADTLQLNGSIEQLPSNLSNSDYNTFETTISSVNNSILVDDLLNGLLDGAKVQMVNAKVLGDYAIYSGDAIDTINKSQVVSSYLTYEDTIDIGEILSTQNKNIIQASIFEEIPPRADFRDYGVINYFNKTNGIYYLERTQKQIVGNKQYNFLTGSQATWSFGTTYSKNDVVTQLGATGDAKYGNNKLYRFVSPNAPTDSYNYPTLDKNNWVPIFYVGRAVQTPYRVIFDTYSTPSIEDLRILPLTIVDISRPINEPKRYNTRLRIQAISANTRLVGTVRLQIIAALFSIRASQADIRIRLYSTNANRSADFDRPVGIEPTGDHGVLFDFTVTSDIQNINYGLFPEVRLVNSDASPNALIYYTIDEVGGNFINDLNIDFGYYAIETESIIPKGYLQRHYKFFRDNLISTKRRNYIGCLQTQDTTTDGRSPVEVTSTAGTSITVSPNILLDEENLGGTNLNV